MHKAVLWIRRVVALAVLACFAALFAGYGAKHLSVLAKLQFWPAVLAGSAMTIAAVAAVTVLAGRWYCGVCCPLGILQDVAFFLRPRKSQSPAPERPRLVARICALAAFLVAGFAGLGFSWIEPYGLFGRIASGVAFGLCAGLPIVALAFWKGRVWCNWVCPVGTILGGLSRFAPFGLKIDPGKCVGCRKCEKTCRASAIKIDGKGGTIDATLCVQCRDCAALCPKGAIGVKNGERGTGNGERGTGDSGSTRRNFLAGAAVVGAAAVVEGADEKTVDGGFAEVSEPGEDRRNASLKPAGSRSIENFKTKCVGCQLCVKACPCGVLRPSKRFEDFMQPEMTFVKGYCAVDCTKCAEVCPAGAIEPVLPSEKTKISIGEAVWHKDRCLAATEGVNCTACYRHCPVDAITRIDGEGGAKVPVVDAAKCIGCGKCEHVCPSRPLPAMTVKARAAHAVVNKDRP